MLPGRARDPSYRTGMTTSDALARALVDEATRKAGLVWLDYVGGDGPRPAWHVWHAGSAYVVTGPGEQHLPGLDAAAEVTVTVPSKDSRARVVSWQAAAAAVAPVDPDWQPVVVALAAGRLNAPDSTTLVERWAQTATVVRLTPTGTVVEAPDRMGDGSHATAPRATDATTLSRRPWMLGARGRRQDARAADPTSADGRRSARRDGDR